MYFPNLLFEDSFPAAGLCLWRVRSTLKFQNVALGALSHSKEESVSYCILQIEANANTIFCAHVYFYETNIQSVSIKINYIFACRLHSFERG